MAAPVSIESPIDAALTALDAAVDQLISALADPSLSGLPGRETEQVLQVAARVDRLRTRLGVTDRALIAELERRGAAEELMARSTAHLLADRLRLTRSVARRRVASAESTSAHLSPTGTVQPPRFPVLAAVQDVGVASATHTATILDGLARIDRLVGLRPSPDDPPIGPEVVQRAERDLCGQAAIFDSHQLGQIVDRMVEALDPDGDPDRSEAHQRQRRLTLRRASNQMWRLIGDLTPEVGQQLACVLRPLARPRPADEGEDSLHRADERTPEQRTHDALADLAARALRAGGLPEAGGTPATVIVTISEESLRERTGSGTLPDGSRLPIESVLRIADEARVIPTVLNGAGAVLWQGRSKRIATLPQTLALYARDGGCSFPGCDHPSDWCERHHVVGWDLGGPTDIDNLTLLCSYHHHRFARRGWTCQMIDGLPHWTAPPELDPDQTPRLHERIRAAISRRNRPGGSPEPGASSGQDTPSPGRGADTEVRAEKERPNSTRAPKFVIVPIGYREFRRASAADLRHRFRSGLGP